MVGVVDHAAGARRPTAGRARRLSLHPLPDRGKTSRGRGRSERGRTPAGPEWLLERGLDRDNIVALQTGQCWDPGKRTKPVTREQAIEALRQQVPACAKCRPDTALGIAD
ncbi:DUF6233 domain-containing protein [Streptomyces sp. NPDC085932]|uniref:DUF6233 domain-containing protein n=1 Tax=Streptomyces sp. NPDC085932 TaxID=3365741 RepID=UPI0037D39070